MNPHRRCNAPAMKKRAPPFQKRTSKRRAPAEGEKRDRFQKPPSSFPSPSVAPPSPGSKDLRTYYCVRKGGGLVVIDTEQNSRVSASRNGELATVVDEKER